MQRVGMVVVGFVSAFVTLSVAGAEAAWKRYHGAACVPSGDQAQWSATSNGIANSETGMWLRSFICDMQESSSFLKASVTSINVYGEDRHPSMNPEARACVSFWASTGGTCGSPAGPTGVFMGQFAATPSPSTWVSNPNELGYVWLHLPSPSSSGTTTVHGMSILTP